MVSTAIAPLDAQLKATQEAIRQAGVKEEQQLVPLHKVCEVLKADAAKMIADWKDDLIKGQREIAMVQAKEHNTIAERIENMMQKATKKKMLSAVDRRFIEWQSRISADQDARFQDIDDRINTLAQLMTRSITSNQSSDTNVEGGSRPRQSAQHPQAYYSKSCTSVSANLPARSGRQPDANTALGSTAATRKRQGSNLPLANNQNKRPRSHASPPGNNPRTSPRSPQQQCRAPIKKEKKTGRRKDITIGYASRPNVRKLVALELTHSILP
ncbi:hypothetical protein IFR05_000500 [Cadophora sp. M221]|nr:hypothetical protein IFR05_000500 [Cadophora sp. M221]